MSHVRAPSRETAAAVPGPGLDQAASFVRELYGQDISLRAGSQDNHPRFRFAETDMLDRVDEFAIANRARVLRSRELRRLFIAAVAWTDKAVAEAVAEAVGAVRAWRARNAAIGDLSLLNDHLLKDIGIHRSEIRVAFNGMLSRPPARSDRLSPALHVAAATDRARPAANDNDAIIAFANEGLDLSLSAFAYKMVDGVGRLVTKLVDRVRKARLRRRSIDELSRLSDRMLADIGLHRGEIVSVVDEVIAGGTPRLSERVVRAMPKPADTPVTVNDNRDDIAA